MAKKKKLKIEKDGDFFDDCPVCQAMKLAQENGRMPTEEELKETFKKAKEKGAIVGGEWFEESNNLKGEEKN